MTQAQILLEIATIAAGAIGRDLAPPRKSVLKAAATKTVAAAKKARPKPKPLGPFTMYDAVTITNIPADPPAVAGYINGRYVTAGALSRRFPHAKLLTISITAGDLLADFLDVETGDATPEQAVGWVKAKIKRGDYKPGVYANRSTMPRLWALLETAGIKRNQIRLWVADWTGEPHIPVGYDACQWHGGMTVAYDTSLCHPGFLR